MRPTALRLSLALALLAAPALAEEAPAWLVKLRELRDHPASKANPDLSWVPAPFGPRDEDPAALREALSAAEGPLRSIDGGVARRSLSYEGTLRGDSIAPLREMPSGVASDLSAAHHVWRERDLELWVLSRRKGVFDQLLALHVVRALRLLQARAPKLYGELLAVDGEWSEAEFQRRYAAASEAAGRSLPWLNRSRALVVVLSEAGEAIATSIYWLGRPEARKLKGGGQAQDYGNVALIRLNPSVILEQGSKQIYKDAGEDAPLLYLRDGLIESLVHEGVHLHISARMHREALLQAVRRCADPVGRGGFGPEGRTVEEAVAVQTSLAAFESGPLAGLHPAVKQYYNGVMFERYHWPKLEAMDRRGDVKPGVFARLRAGREGLDEKRLLRLPLEALPPLPE